MAVITEHSKSPHHYGSLEDIERITLNNPTCGDVISISLRFSNDIIEDIAFSGDGCSISMASSSMMTDIVIGKTKEEALELARLFSEMVQGEVVVEQKKLGEATLLSGVSQFPQRIKCATLAWNALKKAIEQDDA